MMDDKRVIGHVVRFKVNEEYDDNVRINVFAGVDEDHLQKSGELVMRMSEWQVFGSALILGAQRLKQVDGGITYIPLSVLSDDKLHGAIDLAGRGDVTRWDVFKVRKEN
jgi:hypothetical protein